MCELFKRIHEHGVLLGLVDNELREYIRSEKLLEWQRIQEADKLKYDADVISKKLALEEMKLKGCSSRGASSRCACGSACSRTVAPPTHAGSSTTSR